MAILSLVQSQNLFNAFFLWKLGQEFIQQFFKTNILMQYNPKTYSFDTCMLWDDGQEILKVIVFIIKLLHVFMKRKLCTCSIILDSVAFTEVEVLMYVSRTKVEMKLCFITGQALRDHYGLISNQFLLLHIPKRFLVISVLWHPHSAL